ncbi:family 78 glycoside hydrolase catalytic domain [Nocardioides sp. Root140]|uniref:family 78 glycoside hydrolase catalytic domain n=1 Tax=Nocardioides sp. Root140 TaxID=1736460 RepID=UPI0012E3C746|nr:family 78 glycoside hydrolase catalytic domain [Nocardioides sp. Root140]
MSATDPNARSHRRGTAAMLTVLALVFQLALVGTVALTTPTASADAAAAAPQVALTRLQVEKKTAPVGIDVDRPRFSWVIETEARDVVQEGYRLRVATSRADLDAGDLTWDSGQVSSDRSSGVEYDGPDLASATDYVWSVEVTTSVGTASATSQLRTGFRDESDWADSSWIGNERIDTSDDLTMTGASWIWTPEATSPVAPAEPRAFRTTRTTPEGRTAQSAEILITADDLFRLWVNGELVGESHGAENEWQQSHLYTVQLDPASNVFAVRTNNGAGSPAGLVAKVRVTYTDGTTSVFTTGTDWLASKTVPTGFEAPAYDDSAWGSAAKQADYGSGPWGSGVRAPKTEVNPAPLLRREFQVDGDVRDATLFVAAGGYADMSLNGAPVSDDVLSPGFTDYDDTVQYVATDVTDQLAQGDNALGAQLGRGFYGMTGGNVWWWERAPWHDEPVFRAVLHIEYADGHTEQVVTDDSWTIHDGPTVFDDLYGGEVYDARLVQDGYDTVGFDDAGWASATEVDGPAGGLVNQRQQPIRVTESLPAVEITEPADDVYVVKFPRMLAGWVELGVEGSAGTTVRAQYGEKLLPNGRVNFSNNGGFQSGFQTDRFILAGTGDRETWEARFSYKGFQYIEVTGWPGSEPPTLDAFTARVVHTDATETGSFESSSDIMNRTHRAVVDTLKNNIHGIPTDTPMFEKNGWTGDAAVGAEMFMMNLDVHELFAKWMRDVNETRSTDGRPMVIAPSSSTWGEWGVAPPWHSAYIMIPWWLYQYGGDDRVLTEYYDGMKKYVDLEFSQSANGLVTNPRLGDWVSPEASPAGGNAPEDVRVSGTAYLYSMTTAMERTARHLGRDADAAAFADHAATVKATFNATFLDRAAGHYRGNGDRGYRQTHNVLALAFDLAPDEGTEKRVAASIVANVKARNYTLNTGVLGTKYLLPVLSDHGYEDVAFRLAAQTAYPSWGYMIENGATSMWEHWALEARSRGHYFLGTVDDWFYHYVAGIKASETTGYRDLTIAPAVTKQMSWARATTETPYGPVTSDWRRTGRTLQLDVDVPVGSTATIKVPGANASAVTEGGLPAAEAEGVHDVAYADGTVVVTVCSGHYSFASDERRGLAGTAVEAIATADGVVTALRDDGSINAGLASRLLALTSTARADTIRAMDELLDGDVVGAAKALAAAHRDIESAQEVAGRLDLEADEVASLDAAIVAVRDALDVAVADYLELDLTATAGDDVLRPGDEAPLTVEVGNAGSATVHDVRATLDGLPEGWATAPASTRLSNKLAGGDTADGRFTVTVPQRQRPGTTRGAATATYEFEDAQLRLRTGYDLEVASPVVVDTVTVAPSPVRPGTTVSVTATVRNIGRAPASGRVTVEVPTGWTAPEPSDVLDIPAGATRSVSLDVGVPRDARQAVEDFALVAHVTSDGEVLASGTGNVRVAIDPSPGTAAGYDHLDLGVAAAEQAHALTASASSGTSSEAGLTRRYAGHLTPFSQFQFDLAVVPGDAFVLRAVETYDRAQTKRYKVYVDGTEVLLRTFAHTGGVGTEAYEFTVPAALAAADGTVRVKFENQGDPAYYDPSIADVWSRPVS